MERLRTERRLSWKKLLLYIPGTVLEADLFVFCNRRVDDIAICIETLIVCLGLIVNIDLALKPGGVFNAARPSSFLISWSVLLLVINLEDCTASTSSFSSGRLKIRSSM